MWSGISFGLICISLMSNDLEHLSCVGWPFEYWLEGLLLKLQYSGHLMQRANSLEMTLMLGKIKGKRSGWQRMRWLNSITDSMGMNLSKLREIVKVREAWSATVHGVAKSRTWLCKSITTVHPKGDQSWVFIGRTDFEAETAIFWPPELNIQKLKSWHLVPSLHGK